MDPGLHGENLETKEACVRWILFLAILGGCASGPEMISRERARKCIDKQWWEFEELCMLTSVPYERLEPTESFYEGVLCASQSITMCLGVEDGESR